MADSIVNLDRLQRKWILDAFEAANVEAEFFGIRSALMVRINAANCTKIMFCLFGVELVQSKVLCPL